MEAKKRAAAVAALCMLLLTLPKPSHQQLSEVKCECYRKCYPGCKNSTPPWLCKVMCACSCPFLDDFFDPLRTCLNACNTDSICDLPAPLADPEACIDECYNVWGAPGPDPDKEH